MIFFYFILLISSIFCQVKPYEEPNFITNKYSLNNIKFVNNKEIEKPINIDLKNAPSHYVFELPEKNMYNISITTNIETLEFYLIDIEKQSFIGPYNIYDKHETITTDPINTNKFILELNEYIPNKKDCLLTIKINKYKNKNIKDNINPNTYSKRSNQVILVTGYWPPTNEMLRHFSQDQILNPNGWEGENWQDSGYDIISYFPTFDDPACSSCGQGNGILQVDYQNTSNDFWPIVDNHQPIAIITFSRGYINHSWELENNFYNRTNWYNDYSDPVLPTPNPPDSEEAAYFLRNSNLPMNQIVDNIDGLDIGLDPYIDVDGDPGHFVSEFMGYHGVWYRDLNISGEFKCLAAGHVHVGGQVETEIAKLATNETIKTVIDYLDQFVFIPGDVNEDDVIDILDLIFIMNNILGNNELSQIQTYAADLNEDGIINIQDIILIINIILNN